MKGQVWYVALFIALMCFIRFGLGVIGYAVPTWLMGQLHIPVEANIQMPYVIRVWAIRDIVLAVIVAIAKQNTIKPLLLACTLIDLSDVASAQLSKSAGLFDASETFSLQITAMAALIPELTALLLLSLRNHHAAFLEPEPKAKP